MESAHEALEKLTQAKAVLCDIDGCLCVSNRPLPGAIDFAERLGERLYLVSNNSTHSREEMHLELKSRGLDIPPERIVLAGVVAVEIIAREHPGCRVFLTGSNALAALALEAGLELAQEGAAVALLARDTAFTYDRLQALVDLLEGGAALYVANPDLSHPGTGGRRIPETGALLAAVAAAMGGEVPHRMIGKPQAAIFEAALMAAGAQPDEAVMLGDNPLTDIAGARRLGVASIEITPPGKTGGVTIESLMEAWGAA